MSLLFWSGQRGSTRCRHPTNGRAIRRSPAGPLDLTRCAQVKAASSSLPAAFQKENTILTDGVSFWSGRRGSTRYRHPTNGRAIRRSPAGPLDLMRFAPVEAASSSLPAAFQKENTILTDGVSFCDFPPLLLSVNQLFLSCVSDNAQKTMYFNYLFSAASSCKIL